MDPTVAKFRVNGLCAAPFQPFLEDGSVDLASIAAHVR
jgi:dihydrodipicolinate synthase/N-acetylneuraminate lyase